MCVFGGRAGADAGVVVGEQRGQAGAGGVYAGQGGRVCEEGPRAGCYAGGAAGVYCVVVGDDRIN